MQDPDSPTTPKPVSPRAPYGYAWCNGALVPDPVEAPVRKMIYELLVQLRRKKAVARALNEAGHRTRDGSEWSDTAIDRMIRDQTAVGWYRSARNAPMQVQPIVSEELWNECNTFLDSNDLGRRRGRQAVHLFAGFVICHCGRRMYVPTHAHDYRCSTCGNRIAATDLEAIFVEQIKDYPPLATGEGPHKLHDCWPSLKVIEKRRIIEGVVAQIVVAQDDIGITLCAPPDATPQVPQERPTERQPPIPVPVPQASETPAAKRSADEPTVDPVALAIALMKDYPNWSARKLAQAVGCSHTTLTRSPLFRKAKALADAKQPRPHGWRLQDGRIEASSDDADGK